MPYFDGARGRVYFRHWRAAQTPVASLVFLHGFGEHTGLYHRFAAQLNAQNVDVWALDHYGHGLSEGPRGRLEDLGDAVDAAQRLTALAADAHPGVPLLISGHSLGSIVAVLTALAAPERYRGVVVSGAALSPLPWLENVDDDVVALDLDSLSADEFYRDELTNDPLSFTEGDLADLATRLFPPAWTIIEADFPGLTLPVLAVHGADDRIAPLDGILTWRDRQPGLRVEVFDGAAHDVLNEVAHRDVAAAITAFVTEAAGTEAAA